MGGGKAVPKPEKTRVVSYGCLKMTSSGLIFAEIVRQDGPIDQYGVPYRFGFRAREHGYEVFREGDVKLIL